MHDITEPEARGALTALFDAGRPLVATLVDRHGPIEALDSLISGRSFDDPHGFVQRQLAYHDIRGTDDLARLIETIHVNSELHGARQIHPEHPAWPFGVDELTAHRSPESRWVAPQCLWVRGELQTSPEPERTVAFWGHRIASSLGAAFVRDAAQRLAEAGYTVIANGDSGTALEAAHGALRTGRAVAVVAGGFGRTEPRGHEALVDQIAETGLVYTAQAPGFAATPRDIGYRDSLLAAIAAHLVAVELPANARSRPVFTTAAALDRQLYSWGHPWLPHKQLANLQIEAEDRALRATSAEAVVALVVANTVER
jgi:DNA processing protein